MLACHSREAAQAPQMNKTLNTTPDQVYTRAETGQENNVSIVVQVKQQGASVASGRTSWKLHSIWLNAFIITIY